MTISPISSIKKQQLPKSKKLSAAATSACTFCFNPESP
jgi:hypothetical protein